MKPAKRTTKGVVVTEESLARVNLELEYPKHKNKDMMQSLMRGYLKLPV